uniref:50S ribosomal protein L19, chloroplastic n=1 Tax=Pteridomonas danica TaxID=38822 RepID=A0A7T1C535_9STRA|nr:ribosomal protein L19 [Pteridomonas danica]QPM99298.1 ribosomal protein L19 [Pteridomonas danica]
MLPLKIKNCNHLDLFKKFEKSSIKLCYKLFIGDYITVGIKFPKNKKFRIQEYSGLIISKKNNNLNSTVQIYNIKKYSAIQYCFFLNSPTILFLKIHYSLKFKHSKLYYLYKK